MGNFIDCVKLNDNDNVKIVNIWTKQWTSQRDKEECAALVHFRGIPGCFAKPGEEQCVQGDWANLAACRTHSLSPNSVLTSASKHSFISPLIYIAGFCTGICRAEITPHRRNNTSGTILKPQNTPVFYSCQMVKRLELYDNFGFLFLWTDLELENSMALLMATSTWNAQKA